MSASETSALSVVDLRKRFGKHEVLKGISLEARDGARAAHLMGEHLDHIYRDLVLTERVDAAVDISAILGAAAARS